MLKKVKNKRKWNMYNTNLLKKYTNIVGYHNWSINVTIDKTSYINRDVIYDRSYMNVI